jgi:hypothetical protein
VTEEKSKNAEAYAALLHEYHRKLSDHDLEAAIEYIEQQSVVVKEKARILPEFQDGTPAIEQSFRRVVMPGSKIVAGVSMLHHTSPDGTDHSKKALLGILTYTYQFPTK